MLAEENRNIMVCAFLFKARHRTSVVLQRAETINFFEQCKVQMVNISFKICILQPTQLFSKMIKYVLD